MKLVGRAAPNCFTAFRLPRDSLVTVDLLCEALDLTRSQFYRLCIDKYISLRAGTGGAWRVFRMEQKKAASD
jgi:hypothetical protein